MSSQRTEVKKVLDSAIHGQTHTVKGWVRTRRGNKHVSFIALNDGSSLESIQIVADTDKFDETLIKRISTGCALEAKGTVVECESGNQRVELQAEFLQILGDSSPEDYPLQPKKHSLEFMREIAHLRFRSNLFGAINRVRHNMIFAVHNFFNERGFLNIHTPIITGSDCEGAGEMFRVTTLDANHPPQNADGSVDYKQDFFGKETSLTVSGQLEVEMACLALSKVYTFGPTFRAENSNTARHLAEFWMVEPEVAFNNLGDNMRLVEEFLKYLINYALEHSANDLAFLEKRLMDEEKGKKAEDRTMPLREKLRFVVNNDFIHLSYTEAIDILRNSKPNKKKWFQYIINEWGADLQSEHERFLVEKHFKKPVILYNYPKNIKAFYMKQNSDDKTVAAMDVLFPQIGEIVGGSERETDLNKLKERITEIGIPEDDMWWYLDSRRFGSVPHSGFGLGFERLILFLTGMANIRDVIPFPRTPNTAEF